MMAIFKSSPMEKAPVETITNCSCQKLELKQTETICIPGSGSVQQISRHSNERNIRPMQALFLNY